MQQKKTSSKNIRYLLLSLLLLLTIAIASSCGGGGGGGSSSTGGGGGGGPTSVNLPETGQTTCYDAAGTAILCANTGQDGELKKGVAWPSQRFTVDSTTLCITDNLTGLMWVKSPDSVLRTWQEALDYANNLTLCGFSDWRLPNRKELRSLINYGQADSATWLNTQGFSNVQADYYWSSSTYAFVTAGAWVVYMGVGYVYALSKAYTFYVWPVRSGQ